MIGCLAQAAKTHSKTIAIKKRSAFMPAKIEKNRNKTKKVAIETATFYMKQISLLVFQRATLQGGVVDTEGTHLTKLLLHVGDDTHTGIFVHLQGGGQQRAVGFAA